MTLSTFFLYLLLMSGSTYLIRVLPFIAIRHKIHNRFIRSFLYYIPYAVLTAMTIPAIFTATQSVISACVGLIVAVILALRKCSLTVVALAACFAVYVTELIIGFIA
jgi:branched-subunit amino acid transport protein